MFISGPSTSRVPTAMPKAMTAGELIEELQKVDPDTIVAIDDKSDWWDNVGWIELPRPHDGVFTFTINPGEPIDTRQF